MATALRTTLRLVEPSAPEWDGARELQVARRVQARLLPESLPRLDTFACDGLTVPAGGVGGDYYDFLTPRPGVVAMVIADISGHGVPAALMMSSLHALLRSQYALADCALGRRLESVNRLFTGFTDAGHYATMFVGEFDEATRRLTYANCGHPAPMLLRGDGEMVRLASTATVIGAFPDWRCGTAEVVLEPGDDLLIFSDGVTEALHPRGGFYGEDRLERTLRGLRRRDLSELAWGIIGDVRRFTSGRLDDDVTIVAARPCDGRR